MKLKILIATLLLAPALAFAQTTVPQGGTGTSTFATGGLVMGSSTTRLSSSPLKLFWDWTNNRLGIGTSTPSQTLTVAGTANITGQTTLATASSTGLTATNLWSTLANITKGIFTNASSTNLTLSGLFYDSVVSAGSNGNVLQSTGTSTRWVATSTLGISGGSGSPGGSNTQIQFNDSSAFGGSADFTFNKSTLTQTLASTDSTFTINTGGQFNLNVKGDGESFNLTTASGTSSGSTGGDINLTAGNGSNTGTARGGILYIVSGNGGLSGSATNGGNIDIQLGAGQAGGTNGLLRLFDGGTLRAAIFNTGSIATSNKTFTFPNVTGTFALGTGVIGKMARWTSANELTSSLLFDNGTVAGLNATSSTVLFNIQGSSGSTNDIFSVATSTGTSLFKLTASAHLSVASTTGMVPILSGCGTGPLISGSDIAGVVTGGSTSSGCTVTFAKAFTNTPSCVVTPQTESLVNVFAYTVSNTALTVTQTSMGTGKFNYICTGIAE